MQKYVKRFILVVSLFLFSGILFYSNLLVVPLSCTDKDYILEIPKDASANFVSNLLEDDICVNSALFKLAIYITFNQKKIKPGLYSLKKVHTLGELIKVITSVSKNKKRITILEGLNIYDVAEYLSGELNINKQKFINLCLNKEYIKSLKVSYDLNTLEGFLFPDTYVFLDTYTEKDIIEILTKRFMDVYNLDVKSIVSKNKLDLLETIILASIIQGEAMLVEEMPTISSVYHNRLNRKMKLEADPTVLYYMTVDDLILFKNEPGSSESSKVFNKYKNIENPYNTYSIKGLPIGPINNPSLKAIQAALYPENTDKNYLYFVADGTGGHVFSKTLREHNQAIRKIRRGY